MKCRWLFVLLAGLVACTDDAIKPEGNGKTPVEYPQGKGYIALKIVSVGDGDNTRVAGDWDEFDAGREDEWALASTPGAHWVILFNEDGSYYGKSELEIKPVRDPSDGDDALKYNEKIIGTYISEVKIAEGKTLPSKCLVILNGRPSRMDEVFGLLSQPSASWKQPNGSDVPEGTTALDFLQMRLTDALENKDFREGNGNISVFTPAVSTDGTITDYCTMSSSTYVEGVGDGIGEVTTCTEIKEGNIVPTPEATVGNELKVHVERLSAKVEMTLPEIESEVVTPKKGKFVKLSGVTHDGWVEGTDGPAWPVLFKAGDENILQQQQSGGDAAAEAKEVQWGCMLWGWSTNAEARRTYLFKNLDDNRQDVTNTNTNSPCYDNATKSIKTAFFANWNSPERHRCYWSVDGYYTDPKVYPLQYRKVYDKEDEDSYLSKYGEGLNPETGRSGKSPLFYYSYKEIRLRLMGYAIDSPTLSGGHRLNGNLMGSRKYRYVTENTLGEELLKDHVYRGAATHVLILAQLLLGDELENDFIDKTYKGNPSQDMMDKVSDKYKAGDYWYDKAGYMQYAYSNIYRQMSANEERQFDDIFGKKGTAKFPKATKVRAVKEGVEKELADNFMSELVKKGKLDDDSENPFTLEKAEVTNGDGKVLLALKEGWSLKFGEGEGTTMEANTFKSAVYNFVKAADHFDHGRMYYYVPIRHNRANDKNLKEENYRLGDIGIVRNHWYKVNVTDILKPGIPVDDPGQPIIPNIDPTDQYLGLDIHIVPWHVVQQDVELQ